MKKIFKKNQIIIAALAIMIAVAGYLSYSSISIMEEDSLTESVAASDTEVIASDTSQPGEAVLTGSSAFVAEAKVSREQIRSQNKEMLLEVINNESLSEEERQEAVASMVELTDLAEKEAAAEMMLEAKGFEDVVVNLTGDSADVMVPSSQLDDTQRAQIEDIVMRKTEVAGENIVITPMDESM
ncbi:MAG: SpoIIIAH-like family protein [Lachnospiraceae bacterium]|nr:SpoIIIAH-like family protein [Lachnospiraceae bacterium]